MVQQHTVCINPLRMLYSRQCSAVVMVFTIQQTEVLVEMVVVAPSGQRRGFHTDTSAQRLI